MSGGVTGYAALAARVRVKYSNLLTPSELRLLSDAPNLGAFIEALKKSHYHMAAGVQGDIPSIAEATGTFRSHQAAEAVSVIRAAPGNARRVLASLHRRHEVNNIKAALRGLPTVGRSADAAAVWSRVQPLLFPLGDSSSLPLERMIEAGSVAAAVELLRGTRYYEALAFGLKRYSSEQSLFPLEVALDLDYWRSLWQESQKLQGEDHRQATRVVGSLVDANNLMWAVRYKVYKDLSEEELINYTLSFGYRVRDADIRAIAAGAEVASVIARLYPDLPGVDAMRESDVRADLPRLEAQLKRALATRCMAAFLGNPFHVGLPLAFMVLHDLEVQDLITLLEAKVTDSAAEDYQLFLTGMPLSA